MGGELPDCMRDVCEEDRWRLEWRFVFSCLGKVELSKLFLLDRVLQLTRVRSTK
jgi:hypothetical protein